MLSRNRKVSLFFCGAMIAIMIFYHLATAITVADTFNLPVSEILFHGSGLSGTIVIAAIVSIFAGAIIFILIMDEKNEVV